MLVQLVQSKHRVLSIMNTFIIRNTYLALEPYVPLSTRVYILPSFSFDKLFSLPLTLTDSGTSVIPVLLWLDIGEPGHFKLIINIF